MSKTKHLLCLLLLCAVCKAETVSLERAAIVASNFFYSNDNNSIVNSRMVLYEERHSSSTKSENNVPAHYIFQGEDGKGFVIVAAEDACNPIIGYSFEAVLPPDRLPDNMICWLEGIDDQIRFIRENNIQASAQVQKQWQSTRAGGTGKELKTATWDQGAPYNDRCPMDGNENSLTGCTATATAIVMRYHKWPKNGKGKTESYYTATKRILVPELSLNHPYNWDRMLLEYDGISSMGEVAVLMADIGAAYKADYTRDCTIASWNLGVLFRNFGYSSSCQSLRRDDYNKNDWVALLKDEINMNRPVLYRGDDRNNGHVFVIDGYDSKGFFHVNWGWGGDCNGYYSIDGMVPDNYHSYNYGHEAVVNLKPAGENERINNWIMQYYDLQCNTTQFETGVPFDLFLRINNSSSFDFVGDLLLAVTDRNGVIKEVLKEFSTPVYAYAYKELVSRRLKISNEIQVGDRIRAFYRCEGDTEWSLITAGSDDIVWEILIAEEYYLHEITGFSFDNDKKEIVLKTKEGAGVLLYDPDGKDVTDKIVWRDNSAVISTDGMKNGKYKFVVSTDSDSLELSFSVLY